MNDLRSIHTNLQYKINGKSMRRIVLPYVILYRKNDNECYESKNSPRYQT